MSEEDLEFIGTLDIEEDDDDVHYDPLILSDESDTDEDETLEILMRNAKSHTSANKGSQGEVAPELPTSELIEDADSFVRAFLTQMRLHETLNVFQAEWYRLEATGSLDKSIIGKVPLMYIEYYYMDQKLRKLAGEVDRMKKTAAGVQKTWSKLKKERDGFKIAHMRTTHEKQATLKSIKTHVQQTKKKLPTIQDYEQKIETVDKERMLLELEVQRLRQVHERLVAAQPKPTPPPGPKPKPKKEKPPPLLITTALPDQEIENPFFNAERPSLETMTHGTVVQASTAAVGCVAVHPKRRVYATVSDDATWHIWKADGNELLISGRGHTSWISSCCFHSCGAQLATSSADGTVRVWDFLSSKCVLQLSGHLGTVWGCDFHSTRDVIASCGSDSTVRLYSLRAGELLAILRGHMRDVNCAKFIPYSNVIVTGGADHTVALWDARESPAPLTRFRGHNGAVFSVAPSANGNYIASVDCKGAVKLWDLRESKQLFENSVESPINSCSIDASGTYIFTGCDDGKVQVFVADETRDVRTLHIFDRPCESVAINTDADMVVSSSSDGNIAVFTTS